MKLIGITCAGVDANRPFLQSPIERHLSFPLRKRTRQSKPDRASPRPRRVKKRRQTATPLRCDCGQLAVTVLLVRVGSDPQYTIHLPLCPACLNSGTRIARIR